MLKTTAGMVIITDMVGMNIQVRGMDTGMTILSNLPIKKVV
jgi:hypothetical protein